MNVLQIIDEADHRVPACAPPTVDAGVPPELDEFVTVLARLLVADYERRLREAPADAADREVT